MDAVRGRVAVNAACKYSSAAIAFAILMSIGAGTPMVVPHKLPYQWLPYLPQSSRQSDSGGSPRAERAEKPGEKADESPFTVVLPEELVEFCKKYAGQKGMSVRTFVAMILTQGISATAEAEDYR